MIFKETFKADAIKKAREIIDKTKDPIHDLEHILQVLEYSKILLKSYPAASDDLLEIIVWWHDVGRLYGDEGHAQKGSEMAKNYFNKRISSDKMYIITNSIAAHSNREGSKPKYIEGKILKDADKLDFLTVKRWQAAFETKSYWAVEIGINRIPIIRNEILELPESKEMFDKLLSDLRKYFRTLNDITLGQYKKELLKL